MPSNWKNTKETNWVGTITWALVLSFIAICMTYAVIERLNEGINKIEIDLAKEKGERVLISEKAIEKRIIEIIDNRIEDAQLADLDLSRIESLLELDTRIENIEAYVTKRNVLKIDVSLRKPFVRINGKDGNYYLDPQGNKVSTVKNQAVRVPIVTGAVDAYDKGWQKKKKHNLNEVFKLMKALYKDDFLYALIEQIEVDKNSELTLIPKVGPKLIIGNTDNLFDKLNNLKESYKQVLKRKGWENLKALNFDIPNQVRTERVSSLILESSEIQKL